MLADVRSC